MALIAEEIESKRLPDGEYKGTIIDMPTRVYQFPDAKTGKPKDVTYVDFHIQEDTKGNIYKWGCSLTYSEGSKLKAFLSDIGIKKNIDLETLKGKRVKFSLISVKGKGDNSSKKFSQPAEGSFEAL